MIESGGITWAWTSAFVRGLRSAGVDRFFVSPGSRSTPLVLAVAALEGDVCTVVVDERSAAFAALGHARITGRPAAVIATSGSAPAHWFPAIIEADEAAIPLVVISADRPIELQEAGAPQTTDQVRLFGTHVRKSFELGAPDPAAVDAVATVALRAVVAATGLRAGPVHVNAKFRKPLEPTDAPPIAVREHRTPAVLCGEVAPSEDAIALVLQAIARAERPCIIAGPMPFCGSASRRSASARLREVVAQVHARAALLTFTETTSGLSARDEGVHALAPALEAGLFDGPLAPDLVLEIGAPPVATAYGRYAATAPRRIVVAPTAGLDPYATAHAFVVAEPRAFLARLLGALGGRSIDARHEGYGRDVGARLRAVRSAVANEIESRREGPLVEPFVLSAVARAQPPEGVLVIGNSMVVRDVDTFGASELRPGVTVLHQRGASGIDGLVAGAVGARLASVPSSPVTVVCGDVSALHDVGSFALLSGACAGRGALAVVVVNNAGGRIFEGLPVSASFDGDPSFERLYLTPPPPGFLEHVAKGFGVPYVAAHDARALESALESALASRGPAVVEAVVDPTAGRQLRAALRELARNASTGAHRG